MNDNSSPNGPRDPARRRFLSGSGLAIGIGSLGALNVISPGAGARGIAPERPALTLGFIALTDCAPLVIAKEHGLFEAYGLDVTLVREASWANIRDKVAVGALDGAHMLAAMPLAIELGISPVREPMQTSLSLDLNGNGITVSAQLFDALRRDGLEETTRSSITAETLSAVIGARRAAGREKLRFAMVSRFSRHNYELRYWLAAAGIDPETDVELVVVPPVHMVDQLASGAIDGFCVGEPWNTLAVERGVGRQLISSYEIWNNGPEKVFGVTRRFAERHPETHRLLLAALLDASRWLDDESNRHDAARLLAAPDYLDTNADVIDAALGGHYCRVAGAEPVSTPDFNVFHRYAANFPWRSHAVWFVSQMYRWGQVEESVDIRAVAERVYRTDAYRAAADLAGVDYPLIDYKTEGRHHGQWTLERASRPIAMGPDRFLDDRLFDPAHVVDYLRGFDVKHLRVSLEELSQQNA